MKFNGHEITDFRLRQVDTHVLFTRDIDDRPMWIRCRPLESGWDYRQSKLQLRLVIDIVEDTDPASETYGKHVEGVLLDAALVPEINPEGQVFPDESAAFRLNGWMLEHLGPDMEAHVEIYKEAFDQVIGDIHEIEMIMPRLLRMHYMRLYGLTDEHAVDVGESDYVQGFIRSGRVHILRTPPSADQDFAAVDIEGGQYIADLGRIRDRLGLRWFNDHERLRAMDAYLDEILLPLELAAA